MPKAGEDEALAKHQYQESLEAIRAHIEKKNVFKNLSRCLSEDQRAQNKSSAINKDKELRHIQQYEYDKDEQLSRELCEISRQEIVEKRLRQHLRENCSELKALEKQLQAAYINKEVVAQLAEKEAKRVQDKIKEKEINKVLSEARFSDEQFRVHEMQKDINQKAKYKQELQDQMIFKERTKRFEYDEYLREKKNIDDIMKRMFDEDERAREEKRCQVKQFHDEIEAFKGAQLFWKEKYKEELSEEHRKIQEFILSKAAAADAKKEERERKEVIKAKISDQIGLQICESKRKRDEYEETLLQLLEQEKLEKIEQRHNDEIEKEMRLQQDTLTSLNKQVEEHKEQVKKQAEEDACYKQQLVAKIAEDERVEQMSNEKKRLKMVAIRKFVEEQIAENRRTRAIEMQRQMRLLELEQEEAEKRNQLIEEERLRMIQEHSHNLIGFMPKGVINPNKKQKYG